MTAVTAGDARGLAAFGARTFPVWVTACLVAGFAAVGLGGVVRITGSGLGCPDWPTCYGSLIPPPVAEAWIESIHRWGAVLMGAFGLLSLVTAFLSPSVTPGVRLLVVIAAILYPGQAVLGAVTVLWEIPPAVAALHFVTATALIGALALAVAATLGPTRRLAETLKTSALGNGYVWIVAGFAVVIFAAVIAGTVLTRTGAAGVCTGFPFCDTPAASSTLARLQEIHMLHRYLGYFAALYGLGLVWMTWLTGIQALRPWVLAVALVVFCQVALGVVSVVASLPAWSRGGHVLFATLAFAAAMVLAGAVWRGRPERSA